MRVDKMVDKIGASFLYRKRGVYYFSKQVPCDIKTNYKAASNYLLKGKSLKQQQRE